MSSFLAIVHFEYKKLWTRKSIMGFFISAIVAASLIGLLNVNGGGYYHAIGTDLSAFQALKKDRAVIRSHRGAVDEAFLKEVILTTQQVLGDEESYRIDERGYKRLKAETSVAYILPYYNAYHFLNTIYEEKIERAGNEKPIDYLMPTDMDGFYEKYKGFLIDNIRAKTDLSEQEMDKHIQRINQLDVPFYNDYHLGYAAFKNMLPPVGMFILTFIALVCSSVFGKEYMDHTAQIILATRYGKTKVIFAKIFTAISISVMSCLGISLVYLSTFLVTHGFSGGNVAFQFIQGFAYSTYNLTVAESVGVSLIVTVFISIAFCTMALFISCKGKNTLTSLTLMFLIIFVPCFIPYIEDRLIRQIILLLPTRVFDYEAIFSEYFYTVGGISLTPATFYILLSVIISVVLTPFIYKGFKNHQVV